MSLVLSQYKDQLIIEFQENNKMFGAIINNDIIRQLLVVFCYDFKNIDDIEYITNIILYDTTYISSIYDEDIGKLRISIIDRKFNQFVIYMNKIQSTQVHKGITITNKNIVHNDILKRKKITNKSYTYYIL